MPNIGDVTTAPKIGYRGRARFIWIACPDCGVERWRPLHNEVTRCWKCSANHRERQRKPLTFSGSGEPKVGDTARACTVGMSGRSIHIYAACPECGATRWTRMRYKDAPCPSCAAKIHNSKSGPEHPRWKDGIKRTRGYTYVLIPRDDPLAVMATRRYKNNAVIAEHRLQALQEQLTSHEARLSSLEQENSLFRSALQEVRDSIPESIPSLQCYNTLSNRLIEQIEGIVQSTSNGDRDQNRSSCVCRSLILRPSPEMAMKNPANSVKPTSHRYGNAELGTDA